ncbi:unnamed protein product [Arabis nemorensis]|uniref:Uncharacterized protein n=1 Tax=Arabis nemorensis TaxID=586526 RepID=A0A565CBL8_9BRAS|nr:unnamed protein product [Arabis nemorensis]
MSWYPLCSCIPTRSRSSYVLQRGPKVVVGERMISVRGFGNGLSNSFPLIKSSLVSFQPMKGPLLIDTEMYFKSLRG